MARTTKEGIRLTWVKSVDPVNAIDASGYVVFRPEQPSAVQRKKSPMAWPSRSITTRRSSEVARILYTVKASNKVAPARRPLSWARTPHYPGLGGVDIGDVQVSGFTEYNGERFMLEGEGVDINGTSDSFHFAYAKYSGQGTITARIVRPMSSQWTKPGVMMRESLDADSASPRCCCCLTGAARS